MDTFELTELEDRLQVDIRVPAAHLDVLDALADRADARRKSR